MTIDISRRNLLGGAAGASALTVIGGTATAQVAQAASSGFGGDTRYNVSHYAVGDTILTSTSGNPRVYGATTMTCRANTAMTDIVFDLALNGVSVSINGKAYPAKRINWKQYRVSGIRLAAGQTFTMRVGYDDYPRYRVQGDDGFHTSGSFVTFSGEPQSACYWFASNDRLGYKATFSFSISTQATNKIAGARVSSGYTSFTASNGTKMVNAKLEIRQPSAVYHPGLVVGPLLEKHTSASVAGVSVPLSFFGQGFLSSTVETHTIKSMQHFSDRYGAFPFDTAGGVHTWASVGGNQENVGCCVYKTNLVNSKYTPAWVAHEIAHMWFGNSVTASSWGSAIFIQEGLACLLEHDYATTFGYTPYYVPQMASNHIGVWGGGPQMGNTVAYDDALFVQMEIRKAMDGTTVQAQAPTHTRFLKELASRYQYSSISRPQFKALAEEISGKSLANVWSRYGV